MKMLVTPCSCGKDARLRRSASALPSATLHFSSQMSPKNGFTHLDGQSFYISKDQEQSSAMPGETPNSVLMFWKKVMLGGIITSWMLATITAYLRFFARRVSKAGLWYDDWLVIPAMVRTPYAIHFRKVSVSQEAYPSR